MKKSRITSAMVADLCTRLCDPKRPRMDVNRIVAEADAAHETLWNHCRRLQEARDGPIQLSRDPNPQKNHKEWWQNVVGNEVMFNSWPRLFCSDPEDWLANPFREGGVALTRDIDRAWSLGRGRRPNQSHLGIDSVSANDGLGNLSASTEIYLLPSAGCSRYGYCATAVHWEEWAARERYHADIFTVHSITVLRKLVRHCEQSNGVMSLLRITRAMHAWFDVPLLPEGHPLATGVYGGNVWLLRSHGRLVLVTANDHACRVTGGRFRSNRRVDKLFLQSLHFTMEAMNALELNSRWHAARLPRLPAGSKKVLAAQLKEAIRGSSDASASRAIGRAVMAHVGDVLLLRPEATASTLRGFIDAMGGEASVTLTTVFFVPWRAYQVWRWYQGIWTGHDNRPLGKGICTIDEMSTWPLSDWLQLCDVEGSVGQTHSDRVAITTWLCPYRPCLAAYTAQHAGVLVFALKLFHELMVCAAKHKQDDMVRVMCLRHGCTRPELLAAVNLLGCVLYEARDNLVWLCTRPQRGRASHHLQEYRLQGLSESCRVYMESSNPSAQLQVRTVPQWMNHCARDFQYSPTRQEHPVLFKISVRQPWNSGLFSEAARKATNAAFGMSNARMTARQRFHENQKGTGATMGDHVQRRKCYYRLGLHQARLGRSGRPPVTELPVPNLDLTSSGSAACVLCVPWRKFTRREPAVTHLFQHHHAEVEHVVARYGSYFDITTTTATSHVPLAVLEMLWTAVVDDVLGRGAHKMPAMCDIGLHALLARITEHDYPDVKKDLRFAGRNNRTPYQDSRIEASMKLKGNAHTIRFRANKGWIETVTRSIGAELLAKIPEDRMTLQSICTVDCIVLNASGYQLLGVAAPKSNGQRTVKSMFTSSK